MREYFAEFEAAFGDDPLGCAESLAQRTDTGEEGRYGLLKVHLPDMRDTDMEVVIVYQTSLPKEVKAVDLSQFYGCIQDDSLFRHPQPEQPEREPLE